MLCPSRRCRGASPTSRVALPVPTVHAQGCTAHIQGGIFFTQAYITHSQGSTDCSQGCLIYILASPTPRGASPAPRRASPMPKVPSPTTLAGWWIRCSAPSAAPSAPSPLASSGAAPKLPALILQLLGKHTEYTGLSTRASPAAVCSGQHEALCTRVLGSLPTPTSAAATTVAQRHQPAHSEKRGEGTQTSPTPFCRPLTRRGHTQSSPNTQRLSSSRAHRTTGGSDPLPQPLSQIALRFFLRVPIRATDEPRDVTASPSTHRVQRWPGRCPVCCGLTRSRGSPEPAAATVSRSPACTNFLGTAQACPSTDRRRQEAVPAPTAPPSHGSDTAGPCLHPRAAHGCRIPQNLAPSRIPAQHTVHAPDTL